MSTKWKPNIGSFGKALEGSISMNFSANGDSNCSNKCPQKANGTCYGLNIEKLKPSVKVSGDRKRETGFLNCVNNYRKQIAKKTELPWIRFSSFGSVPNRPLNNDESEAFKALAHHASNLGPIHFPVETQAKRERFEKLVPQGVKVRESAHTMRRALNLAKKSIPNSVVFTKGETLRDRIDNAKEYAKKKRDEGLKMVVCPAIGSKKIKCGACTLCSKLDGTIIYPQHS
jgi:hypothetical protein